MISLFVYLMTFFLSVTEPINNTPQPESRKMMCSVSAYTASVRECGKDDAITASGEKAVEGRTIAMENVPFGTRVIINGKEYIVQDRFGHGKDGYIDIFMEDEDRAWEWGRRNIEVEIFDR